MANGKGAYRVGVDFNPSGNDKVTQIKQATAELIDMCNDIFDDGDPEIARLKAHAQTQYEDAAMWAVKAVTKKKKEAPSS